MLICSPLLALRLCSSTIFSCQPLFLLNAVSPARLSLEAEMISSAIK